MQMLIIARPCIVIIDLCFFHFSCHCESRTCTNENLYLSSADPVKILRSAGPNVVSTQPAHQLKKLEEELSVRSRELKEAKDEASKATQGVQALSVLMNYLVEEVSQISTRHLTNELECRLAPST